jgi:hypothetical protein
LSNDAPITCFPITFPVELGGTPTTVTFTATDASGNTSTGVSTVYVDDTTPPEISIIEPLPYDVYPAGGLILNFGATDSGSGVSDCWGTLRDAFEYFGPYDSGFAPGAGVYELVVEATDVAGNHATSSCDLFVVYDSQSGFVTGGGWILSPLGAYMDDPLLDGKANFGFVSKYKKGATVPTGQTEFVFQAGDLNFHSSSYEWLVVAGAKARFKGTGTIMDVPGEYKFMLWAGDNESDTFRIRIWTEDAASVETDAYDNGFEGSGFENGQPIGGGSIIVHTQ